MSDIVYKNFGLSTPFLRGYRTLKIPIQDAHGVPAWPELFPTERIEILRETVGPRHFSAQMMLEYVPPDRARLDPDALQLYSDEFDARNARIGEYQITGVALYWDPSSGHRKSDGSVCVLLYRDDRGRHLFIHDVLYLNVADDSLHPLATQCEHVLDFCGRHSLHTLSVETNGLGNALPEIMHDVASRNNARIYVNKIVNTKNKETRILDSIEPVLTSGRLHAHTRVQQTPLISEMIGWTPLGGGPHDDGLDAVAGAICCTPSPIRPLSRANHIFNAVTDFKL